MKTVLEVLRRQKMSSVRFHVYSFRSKIDCIRFFVKLVDLEFDMSPVPYVKKHKKITLEISFLLEFSLLSNKKQ